MEVSALSFDALMARGYSFAGGLIGIGETTQRLEDHDTVFEPLVAVRIAVDGSAPGMKPGRRVIKS